MQDHQNTSGYYYTRIYMLGDTSIAGLNYNKLHTAAGWGPSAAIPRPYSPYSFTGGLRQDIPGKKVYYYDEYSGTETLLYDFDLNVGDIVGIDSFYYPPMDTIKVFSIDSVLVNGNFHKRFVLGTTENPPSTGVYGNLIEGIGNDAGFNRIIKAGFENAFNLLCFSVNNYNVYPTSGSTGIDGCGYPVGVGELINDKIEMVVFPNPSEDKIFIMVGCKDKLNISLQDSKGTILRIKENVEFQNTSIDLSGLPAGIYFVHLNNSKGDSVTKKIIKE
jgi:hypothetical protein